MICDPGGGGHGDGDGRMMMMAQDMARSRRRLRGPLGRRQAAQAGSPNGCHAGLAYGGGQHQGSPTVIKILIIFLE